MAANAVRNTPPALLRTRLFAAVAPATICICTFRQFKSTIMSSPTIIDGGEFETFVFIVVVALLSSSIKIWSWPCLGRYSSSSCRSSTKSYIPATASFTFTPCGGPGVFWNFLKLSSRWKTTCLYGSMGTGAAADADKPPVEVGRRSSSSP